MQTMKTFTILISLSMLSSTALSASFDCSKAKSHVEKSICKNHKLSALDVRLNTLYNTRISILKTENWSLKNAKTVQKNWLIYQRNTCRSITCIGREYEQRINDLIKQSNDKSLKPIKRTFYAGESEKNPRKFAFGKFIYKHKISIYDQSQPNDELIGSTTDVLTILPIPKKPHLAIIDVDITDDNAHKCTVTDEKFTWRENHWSLFRTESYGKNSDMPDINCEMRVYPTKYSVLIKDIDNECRRLNCGVRAGFDGSIFKRQK